jgi:hypothetical protein
MLETSVWSNHLSSMTRSSPEPGRRTIATGCARHGHARFHLRDRSEPARPGAKSATYSTTGFSCEHGNPDPSAGSARPGKPPGSAKSRTGDGVSVVVGARESRARGEGRQ